MDDHKPEIQGTGGEERPMLPESSSLIILLLLFGAIAVVAFLSLLSGGTEPLRQEAGGRRAVSPEEITEVNWEEPLPASVLKAKQGNSANLFNVPPPPFSEEDIFPCSGCHADMEPNLQRRELEDFHTDIVIDHGPDDRWCFDCHNPDDRDKLRLAGGRLIDFDESFLLCGQCHGTIFRDWKAGIHGRRRGFWDGAKSYLLCAHCHNPHKPHFKPMKPLPPPIRPQYLRNQVEEVK